MQEANIGIFDDLEPFRRITADMLSKLGHHILINEGTFRGSISAIQSLEDELDVALVDGNLDSFSGPGEDGELISQALREKFGDTVRIVSVSTTKFNGPETAIPKADTRAISDFIDSLPDRN
jgi:CheY-like chemotaxis protein